ncbi:hypothetical protein SCRES3_gp108 [Synechococcus phage S-CRES3]|nr:hypothetical protein SCRES3_gp108 [Synechococcus phage S-CRES3]
MFGDCVIEKLEQLERKMLECQIDQCGLKRSRKDWVCTHIECPFYEDCYLTLKARCREMRNA